MSIITDIIALLKLWSGGTIDGTIDSIQQLVQTQQKQFYY